LIQISFRRNMGNGNRLIQRSYCILVESPELNRRISRQSDNAGNYSVFLGASEKNGLPLELFSTEKARWLGVQVQDEQELPCVSQPWSE
jgi:hypothetical protein